MDEPTAIPAATPWALSYRPGEWTVFAAPAAIVVLEPAPARATGTIAEVWQRVLGARSASELTEQLTAIGLDAMATLAVVFRDSEGLHALLRGGASLVDERGEHVTGGVDAGMWHAVDVPGLRCTLRLDESDPGLPTLPLATGVVRAAEIAVDASPRAVPAAVALYPVDLALAAAPDAGEPTSVDEPDHGSEPEHPSESAVFLGIHPLDTPAAVVDEVLHPGPVMWEGSDEPPIEVRTAAREWDDTDDGPATLPDNREVETPAEQQPIHLRLVTSLGQVVDVDRPVIIGRAPVAPAADADAILLTVPSPSHDISRTHVRVAPGPQGLDVTDLHSTNGTILVSPDGAAVRLAPGERVRLEAGSTIDLGDGLTIDAIAFHPV